MCDKELISEGERAELETVLCEQNPHPSVKTQNRLMFECGRARGMAEASASTRSSWLRAAAMVIAVGGGVAAGRWTVSDISTPSQTVSVADRNEISTMRTEPQGFNAANSFLLFRERGSHPSSETHLETHAGMTLMRLKTVWSERVERRPTTEIQPLQDAATAMSAGPFLNPMNQIEI